MDAIGSPKSHYHLMPTGRDLIEETLSGSLLVAWCSMNYGDFLTLEPNIRLLAFSLGGAVCPPFGGYFGL
jgi:hypothetical protein